MNYECLVNIRENFLAKMVAWLDTCRIRSDEGLIRSDEGLQKLEANKEEIDAVAEYQEALV
jgi:hypothetical protein